MKSILTNDICPKCNKYGDISRIEKCDSKLGRWLRCELKNCDYKKQIFKRKSKEQKFHEKMKKKFPLDRKKSMERIKEMRASKKKVTFKGIKIEL